uniref:Uncharacterized protein n=1 Tax=Eptatretus burgeri TaxID=7764 RepID=A0A8C4Q4L6_EPTBU
MKCLSWRIHRGSRNWYSGTRVVACLSCHVLYSPLYRMRIFVSNFDVAQPRFWYFVSQLRKTQEVCTKIYFNIDC